MYKEIYQTLDEDGTGFIIEKDLQNNLIRISHFEDYHFCDDMIVEIDKLLLYLIVK